ncbi:MAG: DNA-binding domain-containing protein [Nibricoccus sp.]
MRTTKTTSASAPDLSPRDLGSWQRTMHAAITRPLAKGDLAERRWFDGSSSARAMAKLVKPSRTLRPIERVEIYNRMYWFRLLDSLGQDFPGLRALLGEEIFWKLAEQYLAAYPSRSFSLRNLGSRLERFIVRNRSSLGLNYEASREMVRFEWAQVVAFDGPSQPRIKQPDLAGDPEKLRLQLQPYLTLLTGRYSVDEFVVALKREALRGEASNAITARSEATSTQLALRRGPTLHLAVHRTDNQLYYKRLEPEAARILRSLKRGQSLAEACSGAFVRSQIKEDEQAECVRQWFALWMRLGWLCRRE